MIKTLIIYKNVSIHVGFGNILIGGLTTRGYPFKIHTGRLLKGNVCMYNWNYLHFHFKNVFHPNVLQFRVLIMGIAKIVGSHKGAFSLVLKHFYLDSGFPISPFHYLLAVLIQDVFTFNSSILSEQGAWNSSSTIEAVIF